MDRFADAYFNLITVIQVCIICHRGGRAALNFYHTAFSAPRAMHRLRPVAAKNGNRRVSPRAEMTNNCWLAPLCASDLPVQPTHTEAGWLPRPENNRCAPYLQYLATASPSSSKPKSLSVLRFAIPYDTQPAHDDALSRSTGAPRMIMIVTSPQWALALALSHRSRFVFPLDPAQVVLSPLPDISHRSVCMQGSNKVVCERYFKGRPLPGTWVIRGEQEPDPYPGTPDPCATRVCFSTDLRGLFCASRPTSLPEPAHGSHGAPRDLRPSPTMLGDERRDPPSSACQQTSPFPPSDIAVPHCHASFSPSTSGFFRLLSKNTK